MESSCKTRDKTNCVTSVDAVPRLLSTWKCTVTHPLMLIVVENEMKHCLKSLLKRTTRRTLKTMPSKNRTALRKFDTDQSKFRNTARKFVRIFERNIADKVEILSVSKQYHLRKFMENSFHFGVLRNFAVFRYFSSNFVEIRSLLLHSTVCTCFKIN